MPPAEPALSGSSRPLSRILLVAALVLLLARVVTGAWEAQHAPAVHDRMAWVDVSHAEAEAARSHRPILYEFGAEWCGPCKVMNDEVFSNADDARNISKLYVPVKVTDRQRENGSNPPEIDRLQKTYGIESFPTLVVAWPGQTHFENIVGYRGRDYTRQWLMAHAVHVMPPADSSTVPTFGQ